MTSERLSILRSLIERRRGRPLAIAHRGASAYATENSLGAFRKAHSLGADLWWVDTALSQDGTCVACHNEKPHRLDGKNSQHDRLDTNKILNSRKLNGDTLPSFADVVSQAKYFGAGIYVNINHHEDGFASWREMRRQGFRTALLGSQNPQHLRSLRQAGCDYPLAIMVREGIDPLLQAKEASTEIIHLEWQMAGAKPRELITDGFFDRAADVGLEVVLWNDKRQEVLRELLQLPVLGICSDQPELLVPLPKSKHSSLKVVCHRGAENLAPENTLSAVNLAFNQGFDIVEVDVQQTKDGVPVIIHDTRVNRTTNGQGKIRNLSYAEVAELDAGSWFDPFFKGEPVPQLEDVLLLARERGGLYLEIKEAEVEILLELVQRLDMLQDCFFWCKDNRTMDQLRSMNSEARLMVRRCDFDSLETAIERHNPNVVEFDGLKFTQKELELCRSLGILSMSFHMSSSIEVIERLAGSGLDMLNLRHPELLKKMMINPEHFTST